MSAARHETVVEAHEAAPPAISGTPRPRPTAGKPCAQATITGGLSGRCWNRAPARADDAEKHMRIAAKDDAEARACAGIPLPTAT